MTDTLASGTFHPYMGKSPIIPPTKPIQAEDIVIEQPEDRVAEQPQIRVAAPPPKGVGVFFVMLTLIGTRLGGGIVGIPFATKVVGYVFAISIQLLYLPVGMFSTWMLLQARSMSGRASLTELGQYCYGTVSIYIINGLVALAQFGFPIIFFIVFGDVAGGLIERVHGGKSFWSSRVFTQSLLGISLIYLILQKDISKLRYAGLVILVLIIMFLILFFIHFLEAKPQPEDETDHLESKLSWAFIAVIPTFIASNTFQTSLFSAFGTLKNKTTKNGILADGSARIVALSVYIISPLLAFAIFGDDVEKNLLKSISTESGVIPTILQFLFLIIAVMHIPIIFYIGKEATLIIFDEITNKSYSRRTGHVKIPHKDLEKHHSRVDELSHVEDFHHNIQDSHAENGVKDRERRISENHNVQKAEDEFSMKEYLNMKPVYYYSITLICFFTIVVLSIVINDVSLFFGIIGSITGSFVIFIGPGSFYIIITHKHKIPLATFRDKVVYVLAWIYVVGGSLFSLFLLIAVIINTIIG